MDYTCPTVDFRAMGLFVCDHCRLPISTTDMVRDGLHTYCADVVEQQTRMAEMDRLRRENYVLRRRLGIGHNEAVVTTRVSIAR